MSKNIYVIKSNISIIPQVVKQILEEIKCKDSILYNDYFYEMKTVLNEMITNSVVHGNCSNENKKVTIKINSGVRYIEFNIIDQGIPFCGCDDTQNDLLKESSRGIQICNYFCDDIKYDFIDGIGNRAIIKFHKNS